MYVSQKVASGRFPTPIFVFFEYVSQPTTVCQNNVEPPPYNFHNYIRKTTFPKSLDKFSFLAAIHFFAHSVMKSKISTSPEKNNRRYGLRLQLV